MINHAVAIPLHRSTGITHATLPGAEFRFGEALKALYWRYPSDVVHVGAATHGEFGPRIGVPSREQGPAGSYFGILSADDFAAYQCKYREHLQSNRNQVDYRET